MSKIVAAAAIRGARKIAGEAENFLNKAIKEKGKDAKVEFPETAFYLPMAYALLGAEVKTLSDMVPVLEHVKSLLHQEPSESLWLPYLGDTLDSGIATLLAEELIVALRYLYGQEPQPDCNGFFTDTILRTLGIQLVDGRMPGFAAILGAAPDNKTAVEIVRELQKRNILTFVGSSVNGRSIIDQLKEEHVDMGWDTYIVPYGRDTITGIYPLHWAIRGALTFGGHKKGEALKCLKYCKERVFAFGLALGEVDDIKYATGAGAINMGFPVIADTDIPEIRPTGICTYEHLIKELDHKKIVPVCIEIRGVKVKVSEIPIPVAYSAAFEGERVRREQMYVQFGGKYTTAFEYVRMKKSDEVEDGKIEMTGPEIDEAQEGGAMPLGIVAEVAGRKMQKDFEPILERQVHSFLNEAMGVFHMGQRDMCWLRISKDAKNKGFKIKHFGVILHARLHDTFGAIVDKAQVKIYTKQEDVEKHIVEAKQAYEERDARMAGMTDESVDTFYSCTLCQSFAPNHLCIVKPERLGLCGAYSYLDAKASFELNPVGPNQPIKKEEMLDSARGEWKGINEFIYQKSNKTLERFHGYSIMTFPETSCCIGNTEVIIDDKVTKIGEFIDKHRGGEEYTKSQALTLSNNKAKKENIIAMQKFPAPKELVEIKTKSGAELTLTREHKISIDRPEGIIWVWADQIKKEDRIISLKKLEVDPHLQDIFDIIPGRYRVRDRKLIKYLKKKLGEKYGTLGNALKQLSLAYFTDYSISISVLKKVVNNLDSTGELWNKLKKSIKTIYGGCSGFDISNRILNKDLFYVLGLLASDGSICKIGKGEFKINFINTNKVLVNKYQELCQKLFPKKKFKFRVKNVSKSTFISKRQIKAQKICYDCYSNNFLLGVIAEYFGIKVGLKGKWNLAKMFNIPESLIGSFLAGIFDGDGSIRLRKYDARWDIGEAYLCIEDKNAAFHLQLLLKRFGIVSYLKKSGSVYKVILYGRNLVDFLNVTPIKHPEKIKISEQIKTLSTQQDVNKTQREVLPFRIGELLTEVPESKTILSPSTYFYYKTHRSRPVLSNVNKAIELLPEKTTRDIRAFIDTDYFLDIVTEVRTIENRGEFGHVYNLTLSDTHSYFANGIHIANCGCFECIVAILPEANGFMVVNREYSGMTPCGMSFSTLAGSVGGGAQTPGFMGVGRLYLVSKKFISADGGLKRIVWMSKELKEHLEDKLKKRCEEEGVPDLLDKIADETTATSSEELLAHLEKVQHPALSMEPLM